jgi:hypothetical protein
MKFAEMKAQCEAVGAVINDAVPTCGYARGTKCFGHSCPSKLFWSAGHRQPGYHMNRALERTGLKAAFNEEIGNE